MIIQWMGYEWLTHERWGCVNINDTVRWNDPDAIKIDDDGTLRLYARPNKKIHNIDGKEIESIIGFGLLSCTNHFKYGTFEIEAKLPNGPYTWPAFWCWAFESYPPEIDMLEGYSNKKGSYFSWTLNALIGKFWKVNTNIHLKDHVKNAHKNGSWWQLGAKNHWLGFKSPNKKFIKYKLFWSPNEISIYYNNHKVKHISDKSILNQFNNKTMNIILNNSVQNNYLNTNMPQTEFIIKYFKYTPL